MAKTNIERFDEMSADILAHLYEAFPIPVGVGPRVVDLTEEVVLDYDPVSESWVTAGERDAETEFFEATLEWLALSGFISKKSAPVNRPVYTLTAYGLQALKHVPRPELGSETLGEKLSSATKNGAGEIAKEALNQALSIGMQIFSKSLGA
ncbi:hypothetical protein [Pseudomonas laurylsulfatiphila]|uniref:hypothetical protein n=1 Tax=Pseudomonas laurylsulfatiphila TaxID=2011015 RepID=UPI003D2436DA